MTPDKPKRGRPPGSGKGLTARLNLKVQPELLEAARARAHAAGITESEWWRRAALAYAQKQEAS